MKMIDIGEVMRRTGLPPSTLRYYEKCGLIRPAGRRGLRRFYPPETIERLAVVMLAQEAGFSLSELQAILTGAFSMSEIRALIATKAEELGVRIGKLQLIRDRLHHAATCRSPSLMDCPNFKAGLAAVLPRAAREWTPNATGRRKRQRSVGARV